MASSAAISSPHSAKAGGYRIRDAVIKPIDEWYQVFDNVENHAGSLAGDAGDFAVCRKLCEGASEVYQLAADMGGIGFIENNKATCMLSVMTNTHMVLAAQEAGTEQFFYAASACVYNADKQINPNLTALAEPDAYPVLPEDGYGREKLFSERMCRHFREDFGIQARAARFHNVYGPHGTWQRGREKARAAICRKVITAKASGKYEIEIRCDGDQTRSCMYLDDCVESIQKITHSKIYEPINLGSSELMSINHLVDIAEAIAGIKLQRHYRLDAPKGVNDRNSHNTKIKGYLGWEPSMKLRDGIAATYTWIEQDFQREVGGTGAATMATSSFQHGSRPIPGDGFVAESKHMNTWRQGIPAGYGPAAKS